MKCNKCNFESDDLTLFVKRSDRKNKYRSLCKCCANKRQVKYNSKTRDEKRAIINKHKSKPCVDCGVEYPHYVMDLDHIDPSKKYRNISDFLRVGKMEELLDELKKCEPVCSNCHRERTYKNNHHAIRR